MSWSGKFFGPAWVFAGPPLTKNTGYASVLILVLYSLLMHSQLYSKLCIEFDVVPI
jgi:hypothetical protein